MVWDTCLPGVGVKLDLVATGCSGRLDLVPVKIANERCDTGRSTGKTAKPPTLKP